MNLRFTGHRRAPRPRRVTLQVLRRVAGNREDKGFFRDQGSANRTQRTISIQFSPEILVNQDLQGDELSEVEAHERTHYRDFLRLANRLNRSLRRAVRSGNMSDSDLDRHWEWFNYDIAQAARALHQGSGRADITRVRQPTSPRP
jgi:hypothetical protein